MKFGFSSVIEFDEAPTEIVLGNSKAFQIEQIRKALVIRPLVHTASTNAFVYFKKASPRLLILTASDEAVPTYFRKVEDLRIEKPKLATSSLPNKKLRPGLGVRQVAYRVPRDFLTVDVSVTANSSREISPRWDLARLNFRGRIVAAAKVWSSRRQVMRDSSVNARFIFTKPNVPVDLKDVELELPIESGEVLVVKVKEGK